MTPSDVRPYTVATIGHPANERVIIKTAQGFWRDVETSEVVDEEDFRAGWRPLVEVADLGLAPTFESGHGRPDLERLHLTFYELALLPVDEVRLHLLHYLQDRPAGPADILEKALGCHGGCAEFVGGKHTPEINPTDGAWRLECSDCGTVLCIRPTREEVVILAREHAIKPLPPYREGSYFQQNTGEACWSCRGLMNCAPGPRCIYQDSHRVTPDA